jgi:hypothetical protein
VPTELVTLLVAVISAGAALAGVAVANRGQSRRDEDARKHALELAELADRRALRDAKLGRLRSAFVPVVIAAWGLRTATGELFFSRGVDLNEVIEIATKDINEARARLRIEEDVQDVFDELERIRTGFDTFYEGVVGKTFPHDADEMKMAYAAVNEGIPRLENLIAKHLRAVERSV